MRRSGYAARRWGRPKSVLRARLSAALLIATLAAVLGLTACGDGDDGGGGKRGLAGSIVYGLSGELPQALHDPRFRALRLHRARVLVSWDLVVYGSRVGAPDAARSPALADEYRRLLSWFESARAAGIRDVLLAVKPSREDASRQPSAAEYETALKGVLGVLDRVGAGGLVTAISPWNEPELSSVTSDAPALAAAYFARVRGVCAERGCTAVAGDLVDRAATLSYIRRYIAAIEGATPRVWSWHAYEDGWDRERDPAMPRLRRFLALLPAGAEVWLTEQGGILRRRGPGDDGRRKQSATAAAADLRFLLDRAQQVDQRVTRFYLYQWQGEPAPRWDSGLIAPDGTARDAYCVFARAAAPRLPAACRAAGGERAGG